MNKIQAWIKAARLRTLPLSISGVVAGSFMAIAKHAFQWRIALLAFFTTLCLQILSNLANDYGDSVNGKDTKDRLGPERMVQSGVISHTEMLKMIIVFSLLSFLSGVFLIFSANINFHSISFFVLLLLGLMAIVAALTYTIGKNPYGYRGLGDISVFLFFGLFSVMGTYFLYTGTINESVIFPAIAVGTLSVGVLNINNLRDYAHDKKTGKITAVVKMGVDKAKVYHVFLITIAVLFSVVYFISTEAKVISYIYLLAFIPFLIHIKNILKANSPPMFDRELKKLALSTLLFSIVFGICSTF